MTPRKKDPLFRGLKPDRLSDQEVLEVDRELSAAHRKQMMVVKEKQRSLGADELEGHPAVEELREAEEELRRLEGIRSALAGRLYQVKRQKKHEHKVTGAQDAADRLMSRVAQFREAHNAASRARNLLQTDLSTLQLAYRDPAVAEELTPLPEETVSALTLLRHVDADIFRTIDLEAFQARLEHLRGSAPAEEPASSRERRKFVKPMDPDRRFW